MVKPYVNIGVWNPQILSLDSLPHTVRDKILASLESSGFLSGRRYHVLPYRLSAEEIEKKRLQFLAFFEHCVQQSKAYAALFVGLSGKVLLLSHTTEQAITALQVIEDTYSHADTPSAQAIATQIRDRRKTLETFRDGLLGRAQTLLKSKPAPNQDALEELNEEIDDHIQKDSVLQRFYTAGLESAKDKFSSFFDMISHQDPPANSNHLSFRQTQKDAKQYLQLQDKVQKKSNNDDLDALLQDALEQTNAQFESATNQIPPDSTLDATEYDEPLPS